MIQLILMIVGVVYLCRRPGLARLQPEAYPHVPVEAFHEWKALELSSIDRFLCATWGTAILSFAAGFVLAVERAGAEEMLATNVLFFGLFVVLLVASALPGSRARAIKRRHSILWPR